MKLESQVIKIDQAKKLKELGVKQKSVFYFEANLGAHKHFLRFINSPNYKVEESDCSAFTCAELGVMLWSYGFEQYGLESISHASLVDIVFKGKSEAEMRAAMLIHLIESGLITVEQINEKL